jgi:beta-glucosidase/6-phospho-beta-glucosidase/beta-galactosidase
MNPSPHSKIYEGELATFWFNDGILYALSKKGNRTLEAQKKNYELIREISKGEKVCMLADASNSSPHDKETREYIEKEMPKLFKAMAVVSSSAVGETITKIFRNLKQDPIPIAIFPDETQAKEWLQQFL